MPVRNRFTRLDAFSKTVEDARVRTTSGGVVTIVSLLVIFWLVWGEWSDWRTIVVHPELIVDKGRGEKMEIHLNITFPHVPCELLTLDVMDVAGEHQSGILHGVHKTRLSPASEGGHAIETKAIELHSDETKAKHLEPDYCGSCGGAPVPAHASKKGCCNTCDEVRDAYAAQSWAFGHGENIEQCERVGYGKKLDEQIKEGCRIDGGIRVNKVVGNFHIAPGRSFTRGNTHTHDLENFISSKEKHYFTHQIHSLRFGPQISEEVSRKMGRGGWTNHHINPLDGTSQVAPEMSYNFMYYVKVVSTSYLPLGWEKFAEANDKANGEVVESWVGLGGLGHEHDGSVETHQYSVTSHKRSLSGGDDEKEGHAERTHSTGGIPGVFFQYDISPMKVVNREVRAKSFAEFLAGVCAVIGGTLTVAAAVDRALYEGGVRVKKLHQG